MSYKQLPICFVYKIELQKRWSCRDHALRMHNSKICTTALTWQPEGKRQVGRAKTTWRKTIEAERDKPN
jgi:hypothetical protein